MKNKLKYVLKKELREVFRDKKSLAMMLIIPFLIPLMVIGMSYLFESEANKNLKEYNLLGITEDLNDTENNIAINLDINFQVDSYENLEKAFKEKKIYAFISKEDNKYVIHYDESDLNSNLAASLAESYLNSYKKYLQATFLAEKGINYQKLENILTYEFSQIEEKNFYAKYVVNYAFMFIIMAITVSATYPATDATAGEKERGTLETLLTFPIKSRDIILGKLLSVTISSIITGLLSLVLTVLSLIFVQNKYSIFENMVLINPAIIVVSIFIILCYSLLISGLCIAIASMSKTFKEAQSALTPLTFISFFPSMIVFLLNIKSSWLLSLIPFINCTLIFQDILNNDYNILYIILMFISTIILIILVINYIVKEYQKEKVLFNN